MIKLVVHIYVERDGDGYYAYCPEFPGLHVGGETLEEVKLNAKDAATAYIQSLVKHGDPIPITIPREFDWPEIWRLLKDKLSTKRRESFAETIEFAPA